MPDVSRAEFEALKLRVFDCEVALGIAEPQAPTDVYVVQVGDTLSGIAARFGTTVAFLVERNDIANPNVITVGQVLHLTAEPEPEPEPEPSAPQPPTNLRADVDQAARTVRLSWDAPTA